MKTLKYIAMAACCLTLVGCEDFLNVNQTQDAAITVTLDQALPVATFYAAQVCYDHAEYGVYMSQALTTASKSQTGSYPYSQGWEFLGVNRHPMWRRHFYDLGANIDKMNAMAIEQGSRNYELIGRTIMLQSTLLTTDIFGDMPRKEAYQATSPKYDSQAEVYEWMFQEADELVRLYADESYWKTETMLPISEKADRIYAGDMKKWAAYAKALRCRIWLRYLPNWDLSKANQIITMVDDALDDIDWSIDEPRYVCPGGKVEQNCPWGPLAPVINSWESRGNRLASSIPATFFAEGVLGCYSRQTKRNGYALDPRAEKIMEPRNKKGQTLAAAAAADKGDVFMRWLESNIGMDVSWKTTYFPDLFAGDVTNPYTKNDGYIALMTQEELLFIKAEAQYWAGDKSGAYKTMIQAVDRNMERFGVARTGAVEELRYALFEEVKLDETQFTIADLMQQKYIAMYLQPEQWTDLRRYNYSSSTNGLQYDGEYVYLVKTCHDRGGAFKKENFSREYALRRPFNLYAAYWDQPDCYQNAEKTLLSDKAWVNRLNPDTETETKYNKAELIRIGACDASGKVDYHWMQKKMIWQ